MLANLSLDVPASPLSDDERTIVNRMWPHLMGLAPNVQEKILGWLLAGVRADAQKSKRERLAESQNGDLHESDGA